MPMSIPSDLHQILSNCTLCPRNCRVDRLAGETGFCGIGPDAVVSSAAPHFGEEPPLVGRCGSGTIFFTGCNLGCVFCQNFDISHGRQGRRVTRETLADMMLELERIGCHNINLVTPTHQTPAIIDALLLAREKGLTVPTVYNCGGYESVEVVQRIEGCVDIYMPDAKFLDPDATAEYFHARDYPEILRAALKEMHRQVGDLEVRDGVAVKGLLVRHLVMPGYAEDSERVLDMIAEEISPNTYVNVMAQYRPTFRAHESPAINRSVSQDEYRAALDHAAMLGLRIAD